MVDTGEDEAGEAGCGPGAVADGLAGHHHILVRVARAAGLDQMSAEDVAQEALARALRHGDRLTGDPLPWLRAVVRNLTIDHLRRHRPPAAALADEHARDPTDVAGDVIALVDLRLALAGLSDRQRQAIDLYYLRGRDRQVSSQTMGISRDAFNKLLRTARDRVGAALRDLPPNDR